ncbi:MAG: hypothetical protein CM15mL1_1940 [Libanvirus sp.]|nr:MAG: hypothetical protein CM15mL1_1940 [Libanvirus sp.]|tara:strand:- start:803 stop:967 length:165 start_codon:yes stop_codon:yes gene_type:complete
MMSVAFSEYKEEWLKRCDEDDRTIPTFEQYLHATKRGREYSAIYDKYGFLKEDY